MNDKDIAETPELRDLIAMALAEDIGDGDVTSEALVDPGARITAAILSKAACTVSGTSVAAAVFRTVAPSVQCETLIADGTAAPAGGTVMRVTGPAQGILMAERTALNFMQRLSGIATLTARFVAAVAGGKVLILDTRKTTPAFRRLEKYAVRCGGGSNHRMGLFDRVMIKDNHRRLWGGGGVLALDAAVREARRRFPGMTVEVEVESLAELQSALAESPEWILLDNMSPARMKECVALCGGRSRLEASGGITLETISEVAATGINAVSLGCLTHSAPAADLSLEIENSA